MSPDLCNDKNIDFARVQRLWQFFLGKKFWFIKIKLKFIFAPYLILKIILLWQNYNLQKSLKIIQEIIQQRKQKYEANGFFLLFWGALIALSGIVQFTMLISNFLP